MSGSALPPTAPTTLVIVLGASAWPKSSGFQASEAFVHAAQGFRDYMLDPHGFGLPAANLLDLFEARSSVSYQLEQLGSFLEQRTQALKAANQAVRDVLVYFVGHGGFAGPSADYYLIFRRTNASSLRASGMAIDALAEVLREKARQTRRYLFLDCCFAAAAFRAFQGGPDQTAIAKTLDAFRVQARSSGFPGKGTVLLYSSDQTSPSLLLPDESCTMFSYALLDVLRNGDLHRPLQLSLRDIKELAEDRLAALPEKNAPRPGLYSPDQSEGDAADVPFFPNPRAEEERARKAEAERRRLAKEAVRTRRIKEKRQRRVEEEQARQAESAQPPTELITPPSGQSSTTAASDVDRPVQMIQQRRLPTRRTMLLSGLTLAIVLILVIPLVGLYGRTRGSTPTPTAASGKTVHLQEIHMFNASTGWAMVYDLSNHRHILHTTSGVAHWQDVSSAFDTPTLILNGTDFFNPSTAWVAVTADTTYFVYRTHDGGQTWQKAQLPNQELPDQGSGFFYQIFFLNAQVGWILFESDLVAAGHVAVGVLHTSDGGATWKVISVSDDKTQNNPTAIPFFGDKSGISFVNDTTGWVTGSSAIEHFAWLYITHDGGVTWQHQSIPLPADASQLSTLPPVFFNATDGILPAIIPRQNGPNIDIIYTTQDGGANWSSTGLVPVHTTSTADVISDFVDAMHGWIVSNTSDVKSLQYIKSTVYSTSDGGESWTQYDVKLSADITMIDFTSPTQGWAMDSSGFLYQTMNSGQTWTKVTPTVA